MSTKAKKCTGQYLLYGCDRTDAVMRTKTKKVPTQGFAMQYKEGSRRQYLLYGCDRTDAVMRTKTKKGCKATD